MGVGWELEFDVSIPSFDLIRVNPLVSNQTAIIAVVVSGV